MRSTPAVESAGKSDGHPEWSAARKTDRKTCLRDGSPAMAMGSPSHSDVHEVPWQHQSRACGLLPASPAGDTAGLPSLRLTQWGHEAVGAGTAASAGGSGKLLVALPRSRRLDRWPGPSLGGAIFNQHFKQFFQDTSPLLYVFPDPSLS